MAGHMTSNQQKWYHLVGQAQSYLIHVNLFRSALTKQRRGSIKGSRVGALVRALASHQCDLGSNPGLDVVTVSS